MKDKLPINEKGGATLKRVLAVIFAVAAIFCAFTCGYFFSRWQRSDLNDILEIYDIARDNYVGDEKISDSDYAKYLVNSVFDRYSEYYTAEEYEKIQQQSKGGYGGLGIALAPLTGKAKYAEYDEKSKFTAYKVYYNSPAYNAGLRARDMIIGYYDGDELKEFNSRAALSEYLGALETGEQAKMLIKRETPDGVRIFDITTAKAGYRRTYVFYADSQKKLYFTMNEAGTDIEGIATANDGAEGITRLDDDTAYIALSSFEGTAAREIRAAMRYMQARGKTKLIFDLSDNGGGYIDVLCEVASSFIYYSATNTPVVLYAKDKNGRMTHFSATGGEFNRAITSISVIANENTASASEALLGAMLHYWGMRYAYDPVFNYTKLVLIKKTAEDVSCTYGKGVMQSSYILSTGAVFKLTTATLTFPDMTTCINGVGIRYPDGMADKGVTDFYAALNLASALL